MAYQDRELDTWLEIAKELASFGNIIVFRAGFDFMYSAVTVSFEIFGKYKEWWKRRGKVNISEKPLIGDELASYVLELEKQKEKLNDISWVRTALLKIINTIVNNKQLVMDYKFKAEIGEYFHLWGDIWYHCKIEKFFKVSR